MCRAIHISALLAAISIPAALITWSAIAQFDTHYTDMFAIGLTDPVSMRHRLLMAPSHWVLGEWLTALLLTLFCATAPVLHAWLGGKKKLAIALAIPVWVISIALSLSLSRGIVSSMAVFAALTFSLLCAYRVVPWKRAVTGACCAVLYLGGLAVLENVRYPGVLRAYSGSEVSQVRSTEGRLAIWKRSTDVFLQHPLTGVGSGNAPLYLASSADQEETTGFASRTFSLPVQILVEKGIIGAVLYLSVLVFAAWEAHRKLRDPSTSREMKVITCCLAAGVIAVLFRELTYASLLEHPATAMLFTMLLALIVNRETG